MGIGIERVQKRRKAKSDIAKLMQHPEQVIVIHYSCESFYDKPDGASARITSIAVRNFDTAQTTSFSIHQMAERKKGVSLTTLEDNYGKFEKAMLDEFYEYVKSHKNYNWLHWNMRDIQYGFPAIAHRYKVLGGKPVELENSMLYDLSRLLVALYGIKFIGHPRLETLVEKNFITKQNFLTGAEEAKAFDEKQYVKLHQSTLRKVDVLADIIERAYNDTLKTNADWKDIYGDYPQALYELIQENWIIASIIVIISLIGTIVSIMSIF